jgi:endonuclease/exonuclease/phosphatase family metal-dependent hydrolase
VPLSILTLNIWNQDGPWAERARLIREWIDRLDPDVIGLQEVLVGEGRHQAEELLEGRGYAIDFESAIPFWEDPSLEFGNAVASRWPIAEREGIELPGGDTGERRVALSVTIDAPVGPLSFTVTHLHWRPYHGFVREQQVVALCDLALRRRPRGGFPPILAGDFNAEPDSTEIRYVTGLQSLGGRSVYLRDAFAERGEGNGHTWSNRNAFARLDLEPDRRIDYVFVGPPRRPDGLGLIESCTVVCDEGEGEVWPSDHLGVYAELRDGDAR